MWSVYTDRLLILTSLNMYYLLNHTTVTSEYTLYEFYSRKII